MKNLLFSLLAIAIFGPLNAQAGEVELVQEASRTDQFERFDTKESLTHATVFYKDSTNWDTLVSQFTIPALTNDRATATLCVTAFEVERVEQGGIFKKKKILHYKRTQFNASKLRTMKLATAEERARFTLVQDDMVELYWLGLSDGSGFFALDSSSWRYTFCGTRTNGTPWVDVVTATADEQYLPIVTKNGHPTQCSKRNLPSRLPRSGGPFIFSPAAEADALVEQCRVAEAESKKALAAHEEKCMAEAWADWERMRAKGAEVRTGFAATLTVGMHCKAKSE